MFKNLYIFFGALFVLFLVIAFSGQDNSKKIDDITELPISGGWIEILYGKAFLTRQAEMKELFSGDIISGGDKIETKDSTRIVIHLYDGSVLRAESNTIFTIEEAIYGNSDGKVVLSAELSSGKIWSKIVELATPDSLWQIKTSNAVATVRGSAFGVVSDGKTSEIVGSEHDIAVYLIDPITKENLLETPIVVAEDTYFEISDREINTAKNISLAVKSAKNNTDKETIVQEAEKKFSPIKIDEKRKKDNWINENEKGDMEIRDIVDIIRKDTKEDKKALKEKIHEKVKERFKEVINKSIKEEFVDRKEKDGEKGEGELKVAELEKKENLVKQDNIIKDIEEIKTEPLLQKTPETSTETKPSLTEEKWGEISIITQGNLNNVSEGQIISFRAILKGDKGTEKDITREALWKVIGSIGIMEKPGSFFAKLGQDVAEYGEGVGVVVATWKDPVSGEEKLGTSSQINVFMKFDNLTAPIEETEVFLR